MAIKHPLKKPVSIDIYSFVRDRVLRSGLPYNITGVAIERRVMLGLDKDLGIKPPEVRIR